MRQKPGTKRKHQIKTRRKEENKQREREREREREKKKQDNVKEGGGKMGGGVLRRKKGGGYSGERKGDTRKDTQMPIFMGKNFR